MDRLTLRPARETDVPALLEIYNYYVRCTAVTFDLEPAEPQDFVRKLREACLEGGAGDFDAKRLDGPVPDVRDVEEALQALAAAGCIRLYEAEGHPYLCFPEWEKHQNVRNKRSRYPAPP